VLLLKGALQLQVLHWGWRRIMVLTLGDIKAITAEIASQIITELRKPVKNSFSEIGSARVCETNHNDKDAGVNYFKDHERRIRKQIENKSAKS
jgi:hypothetical protein